MGKRKAKRAPKLGAKIPTKPSEMSATDVYFVVDGIPGAKAVARFNAMTNIPGIIEREIKKNPEKPWSPEYIVREIRRGSRSDMQNLLDKLEIGDAELLTLAKKAMKRAGYEVEIEKIPLSERLKVIPRAIKGFFIKSE